MDIKSLIKGKNTQYIGLIKKYRESEDSLQSEIQSIENQILNITESYNKCTKETEQDYLEKENHLIESRDSKIAEMNSDLNRNRKNVLENEHERQDRIKEKYAIILSEIDAKHKQNLDKLKVLFSRQLEDNERDYQSSIFVIDNSYQVNQQFSDIISDVENKEKESQIQLLRNEKHAIEERIEKELNRYEQQLIDVFDYSKISSYVFKENEELLKVVQRYLEITAEMEKDDGNFVAPEPIDEFEYLKRREEAKAKYLAAKTEIEDTYNKLVEEENQSYSSEKGKCLLLQDKELKGDSNVSAFVERMEVEINKKTEKVNIDVANRLHELKEEADKNIASLKKEKMQRIKELEDKKSALENRLCRIKEEKKASIDSFLRQTKEEVDAILNITFDYTVGIKDLAGIEDLPNQICIGEYTSPIESCELIKVLYGDKSIGYQNPVFVDLRESGNIIINSSVEEETNESLYRVVCGLTLKFMEEFPLGSLRVHFVDVNQHVWFNRFMNAFLREDKNPICKQLITNDSKVYSKLEFINNNDCEAIMQRTIGDIQDLFDLYQVDKTYPFHLFVIRSGFAEVVENGNIEYLRLIKNLMSDRGIKSGVRFIIINDYKENDRIDSRKKQLLDEILKRAKTLNFKNNQIFLNDSEIVVSSVIEEDGGSFMERRSVYMAEILAGKQGDKILYEDIGFDAYSVLNKYSSVISIPVGKLGNQLLEIPFNCGSEMDGPANSGYIALGRTSSGKSSFFHSLVINGCMKYSPDDVQFWLLDFKNGGASSNYEKANIPHIKLLSKKNKIDDAYCLLNLLRAEMDRRGELLNEVGKKYRGTNFQDLNEYNQCVDKNPELGSHLSRIIVVIDEAQEMFMSLTEDNDDIKKIGELIATIAVRSRYVGIHMVMIAQNLSIGRSQVLKESFVGNIKGKVTFGIDESFLRESGFGQAFYDNHEEIKFLRQGEAFLTCNDDKPEKVKIAYCAPIDFEKYFERIRKKYNLFECNMAIIGNTAPLLPKDKVMDSDISYEALLQESVEKEIRGEKIYNVYYGEDAYSLNPTKFVFNSAKSGVVAIGSDNRMMASIGRSILTGVDHLQRKRIFVCNGSGTKEFIFNEGVRSCSSLESDLKKYKMSEIDFLIRDVYYEFARRQKQKEDEIEEDYIPFFIIINDITSISKIKSNITYQMSLVKEERVFDSEPSIEELDDMISGLNDIYDNTMSNDNNALKDDILNGREIWDVIEELCKDGSSVGIYFNFTSKDAGYHVEQLLNETSNKVIFNDFVGSLSSSNYPSYIIRPMLNGMRNDIEKGETLAVSIINGSVSKVRPVIFNE